MDLVAWGLCATAAMPVVFVSTLTLPTNVFFLYFLSGLWVSVRLGLGSGFIFYF